MMEIPIEVVEVLGNVMEFHWKEKPDERFLLRHLSVAMRFQQNSRFLTQWRKQVLQTAVVEVLNAVPSVSIEWPSEVNSLVPLTPIVTATDGDQDDLSLVYSWFKNGFRDSSMDGMTVLSEQRMEPGQEWSLVIVANDGTVNSTPVERSITVENIVPRADIRFVSTDAWLGETVHLSADESFDADSRITQYQWAWAEGTGNGDTLSFVLERNTQVSLTVIDEHGGENTTQINITSSGRTPSK
jgi:hypothetical protein